MKVNTLNNDIVVKCENITKIYDLNKNKKDSFKSFFSFGLLDNSKPFAALNEISFSVESGISVGIIGLNGSGKSTLSNILGGIIEPTVGTIYSKGIPSLIAIGVGLNNDFTGIENIYYKCYMHGLTKKQVEEKISDIIAFSELDKFIEQPLKSYSSGMRSRLGFSIAIHCDPDILIIDEALSVGDDTFANKCISKIKELQNNKKNIFFVSHSAAQIRKMCDKAIWLHYGKLIDFDNVDIVVDKYLNFISSYKDLSNKRQISYKSSMIKTQEINLDNRIFKSNTKISKFSVITLILLTATLFFIMNIIINTIQ